MTEPKHSPRKKAQLVLASLALNCNKTALCTQNNISRSTLYSWQKTFLSKFKELR